MTGLRHGKRVSKDWISRFFCLSNPLCRCLLLIHLLPLRKDRTENITFSRRMRVIRSWKKSFLRHLLCFLRFRNTSNFRKYAAAFGDWQSFNAGRVMLSCKDVRVLLTGFPPCLPTAVVVSKCTFPIFCPGEVSIFLCLCPFKKVQWNYCLLIELMN